MSAKTWCFTLNNPSDDDLRIFQSWVPEVTRLVVTREIGESGTPHFQGALTSKTAHRLSYWKKMHPKVHWEIARARDPHLYPKKHDSEPLLDVDNRAQGARSDLEEMKAAILDGASKEELLTEHFVAYSRAHRAATELVAIVAKKRKRPQCCVEVVVGPAGAGKSTYVDDAHPDAYWLSPDSAGRLWWDGYDGENTVVLDDFDGSWMTYKALLKLLNWSGKLRCPTKGGSVWITAERFIITSVEMPESWYSRADEQLFRRIHKRTVLEVETSSEVKTTCGAGLDADMFEPSS